MGHGPTWTSHWEIGASSTRVFLLNQTYFGLSFASRGPRSWRCHQNSSCSALTPVGKLNSWMCRGRRHRRGRAVGAYTPDMSPAR